MRKIRKFVKFNKTNLVGSIHYQYFVNLKIKGKALNKGTALGNAESNVVFLEN